MFVLKHGAHRLVFELDWLTLKLKCEAQRLTLELKCGAHRLTFELERDPCA